MSLFTGSSIRFGDSLTRSSVITLTLFPTLLRLRIDPYEPASVPSSIASSPRSLELPLPTSAIRAPSFIRRLAAAVADELEYLLHWDLPISTMVYFNEVGESLHSFIKHPLY